MKTISIPRQSTNVTALDDALQSALADNYLGISIHDGTVRVHLLDETPSEQVQQAGQLVANHDPAQLTAEQ